MKPEESRLYTITGLDWTTGLHLELEVQHYISIVGLTGIMLHEV